MQTQFSDTAAGGEELVVGNWSGHREAVGNWGRAPQFAADNLEFGIGNWSKPRIVGSACTFPVPPFGTRASPQWPFRHQFLLRVAH